MGGKGSGGFRWGQPRATVEESLVLDVRALGRCGVFAKPTRVRLFLGDHPIGAANFDPSRSRLIITIQNPTQGPVTQDVRVSHSSCHLGGVRPWFHCPHCHARVAKLYCPSHAPRAKPLAGLACRTCLGLSYRSRNTKNEFRVTARRLERIQRRLMAPPTLVGGVPPKPVRMRWETYDRHMAAYAAERRKLNKIILDDTAKHFPELIHQLIARHKSGLT